MKNEGYISALNTIEVSSTAKARIFERASALASARKARRRRTLEWAAPLAACLVLAVGAGVWQLRRIAAPPMTAENSNAQETADIRGLPASDFVLGNSESETFSMIGIRTLREFYSFHTRQNGTHQLIAFVRILSSSPTYSSYSPDEIDGQIVTCEILQNEFFPKAENTQQAFTLELKRYTNYAENPNTVLLRQGGVYLLPLSEYEGVWYTSVSNVLFEIDDLGLVHTHSPWKGFAKYNGKPLSYLLESFQYLRDNPMLYTQLGDLVAFHHKLTIIYENRLVFQSSSTNLTPEEVYEKYIDEKKFETALIVDGKITVEHPENNVFTPYVGRTIDDIKADIEFIEDYLKNE